VRQRVAGVRACAPWCGGYVWELRAARAGAEAEQQVEPEADVDGDVERLRRVARSGTRHGARTKTAQQAT
jgi:hypothetical protein